MIVVTQEELAQFRSQLADHPQAMVAIDTIEECEGYLEDALSLLAIRQTGQEADRGLNDWLGKCRQFICLEEVREALESGVLAPAIEVLAVGASIPPGIATALSICVFKLGTKRFCTAPKSDA